MNQNLHPDLCDARGGGWLGLLLLAAGLCCAVSGSAVLAADVFAVSQRDRQFSPDQLRVPRGAVVRILNDDKVTHHVYVDSPEMRFDSGEQPIGTTVELRFDQPGVFDVQCAIHPAMLLEVTVE